MPRLSKVRWEKVHTESYKVAVTEKLSTWRANISSLGRLDLDIRKLNEILFRTADDLAPKKFKLHRKAKLKNLLPRNKASYEREKIRTPAMKARQLARVTVLMSDR